MDVAVAHPTMRTAFLPALNINVCVSSSKNKDPEEALGPCLAAFPWLAPVPCRARWALHGKAAARLPQNRIILLEGQSYTKACLSCLLE